MAVDYFLKLDGIEGESTDNKHAKEIDVEAWSWGESQTGSSVPGGGGGGAGKVSMQDFSFVVRFNKASPKLMLACATGKHIKSARLAVRRAGQGQQDYLTFTFLDVLVSSYQTGGAEASGLTPVDQVSLRYAKVEVEYKTQKPDGTLIVAGQFKFDLKQNKSY
jgi:type VI secretion system secreted protein Hcp